MVQESETSLPQLHMLLLVCQEISDPPADAIRHVHLGRPALDKFWSDGVHEQDPGVGTRLVQML